MSASLFSSIKREYFPRWDRNSEWKCKFAPIIKHFGDDGYCEDHTKTIYISSEIRDTLELKLILIHEICHAITKTGHCMTWEKRMLIAAERAEKLGEKRLSRAIQKEISWYRKNRAA